MTGLERLRQSAGTVLTALPLLLLAACASDTPAPAPLILKGPNEAVLAPALPPPGEGRQIVVRPGQSLRTLAQSHHVAPAAIIASNHLRPPYKLEVGQNLLIPSDGAPPALSAAPHIAAGRRPSPEIIPLDATAPRAAKPAAREQAAPTAGPDMPPTASRSSSPQPVAPSPPSSAKAAAAKPAAAPVPASAASAAPAAAAAIADAATPHGAHFPWPVHGRVLTGYGVAPGGAHNDGINIAAARGAPIAAVAGGTIAYAGNELRGYGNLVLVKHPNGWISAYAHCDDVLVKRGDKVSAGQVIAKVGATGGVGEPQLHFELRRGQRPVDPREFLSPAPSAASSMTHPG